MFQLLRQDGSNNDYETHYVCVRTESTERKNEEDCNTEHNLPKNLQYSNLAIKRLINFSSLMKGLLLSYILHY